jgi:hypothetical protein
MQTNDEFTPHSARVASSLLPIRIEKLANEEPAWACALKNTKKACTKSKSPSAKSKLQTTNLKDRKHTRHDPKADDADNNSNASNTRNKKHSPTQQSN